MHNNVIFIDPPILVIYLQISVTVANPDPALLSTIRNDVLAAAIFMVASVIFYMICYVCQRKNHYTNGGVLSTARTNPIPGGNFAIPPAIHSGLDAQIIDSQPTYVFSEVKDLIGIGSIRCAICLSEYETKESLRLLLNCDHVFHAHCIDVWFRSRTTCPVCRVDLSKFVKSDNKLLKEFGGVAPILTEDEDRTIGSSRKNPSMALRSNTTEHGVRLPRNDKMQVFKRSESTGIRTAILPPVESCCREGYRFAGEGERKGRIDWDNRLAQSDRWVSLGSDDIC